MTRIVYDDGLGPDFFPALMAATAADRDLTPAEIASFEREYRRQRGRKTSSFFHRRPKGPADLLGRPF
jgi:hypothetical protein